MDCNGHRRSVEISVPRLQTTKGAGPKAAGCLAKGLHPPYETAQNQSSSNPELVSENLPGFG
jgi:hypothetical protein